MGAYIYHEGYTTASFVDYDITGTTQSRFKNDGPGDIEVKADTGSVITVRAGEEFGLITAHNTISVKSSNGTSSFFRALAQ